MASAEAGAKAGVSTPRGKSAAAGEMARWFVVEKSQFEGC